MLVLTEISRMDFRSGIDLIFSVIKGFKWFFHRMKIQLMLVFLEAPFFVLHFSYYASMTSLMMLSVILLFMLIILLSYSLLKDMQQLKLLTEVESDQFANLQSTAFKITVL